MDGLSFRRVAGGSIIDNPPLFSENGEILFTIITRADLTTAFADGIVSTVRAYSTKTGECVRDIEVKSRIVNIENMPGSPTTLVGCTDEGVVFTWNQSGTTVDVKTFLSEKSAMVNTFNIVSRDNKYFGLVTWTCLGETRVKMNMFDLVTGQNEQSKLLELESGEHKVVVSRNECNIIAAIQNHKLFVKRLSNRNGTDKSATFTETGKKCLTAIACHPVEETVAVGDETGKIFIYHAVFKRKKNPLTTLHHWHHNRVETIAFTSSGSLFYSGGAERVLVGWNDNDNEKKVRPRLNGTIVHIAVSSDNQQIAVSTDDNGITLVDPQFTINTVIQHFVRAAAENTPWPLFPLGLKLDPRTGYIILNGRIGQVQFYSPHDRTFFNLDVTMENRLSLESDKILYNTRITHLACNVDWLVTAECLDDLEHFTDVRLKFWLFDVTRKIYVLNTQIESPHEKGVTALEFSSSQRVDNLLCASSGRDGEVKIWSMEESEVQSETPENDNSNTTTRTYWVCLEKISYKDLAVNSLAFSSDGSTLAVGFGNALCIYIAETLRLKAVLSAPSGQDGSTNKLIVSNPNPLHTAKMMKNRQDLTKKYEEIVRNFLENDDDQLIKELLKEKEKTPRENRMTDGILMDEKKVFDKILALNELNFCQKLELFQKMGIHIKIPADLKTKFDLYIRDTMAVASKEKDLIARSERLDSNTKFIGRWMIQNYLTRRSEAAVNGLHTKNITFVEDGTSSNRSNGTESMEIDQDNPLGHQSNPIRKVARINHVVFATGDSSHLVIVCTENRLLIWNLLTLRLQSSWKLNVRFVVVDPCTSLVAVSTIYNELYVFSPSEKYVLYHRKNVPKLVGGVWMPRREPRKSSLDVDWQSVSQLFLFTRAQELLYLVADNDEDLFADKSTNLKEVDQLEPQTQFWAMFARQVTNDAAATAGHRNIAGGLVGEPTKMSVRTITNLQTHTMAPMHRLCFSVLRSLNTNDVVQSKNPSSAHNADDDVDMDDSDIEETSEVNRINPERLESAANRLSEEYTQRKNAEFNKISKENPKYVFTFMKMRGN